MVVAVPPPSFPRAVSATGVDLLLRLGCDDDGHRRRATAMGSAVQRCLLLPIQFEGDRHHRTSRMGETFGIAGRAGDAEVRNQTATYSVAAPSS